MINKFLLSTILFLTLTASAHADPISLIVAAITTVTSFVSSAAAAIGALASFSGLVGFLTSPIGALLLGIGIQLVSSLFLRGTGGGARQNVPTVEAGKVNVKITEPERWIAAGQNRQGGGVLFAEFDSSGNFWYLVVHCDSILTDSVQYYFDDEPITLDGSGNVTTNDFCVDSNYNTYSGSGTKVTMFQIFTTTYTHSDPVPPAIAALQAAFPGVWTTDHKLVGTTYSVVKVKAVPTQHRYKVYKWRGPIGMGEPSISIVGKWSYVYDPRDVTQDLNDKTTWKFSKNTALIWAWFRTHRYGRNKALASINWDRVGEQADICDENVVGLDGTFNQYECGTTIPESKERSVAEQEILLAMDGQLVFDDDGLCWARAGYYYAPTLKLVRNRDIVAMDSVEAQNGESETQGVIVRYMDPDAKYTVQPAAAWLNPNYYVEGETPNFLKLDAQTVQNHNQAMRLAKAFGMRSQPLYKLLPTVGLRGLKARQERNIELNYDNTFAGDHEIVTNTEVDPVGVFVGFGVVPVDENRWKLLAGEEKSKPVYTDSSSSSLPQLPTGIVTSYTNNRIEVTFDHRPREDVDYKFQWALSETAPDEDWTDFATVDMENDFTHSGTLAQNETYYVRWRAVTTGGRSTAYVDPPTEVGAVVISLTGTPVTTGEVGVAYTGFTISASGGTTPYLFVDTYGRLPPGITIDAATGAVSGTPTTDGTYSDIRIRVTDDVGNYNNFTPFTITIDP